jgi:uncharacterized damage-inducible protein DinB
MERTKGIERKFSFNIPEGWLPNILERLQGTSPRIEEIVTGLTEEQAEEKTEGKWSIKEHIGHLLDLEELHEGRIDDFVGRKDVLRAADMSNAKTYGASHNSRNLEDLINRFGTRRSEFVKRLRDLDDESQRFRSLHPRLQEMMRPVDMAFFTAEHDDHHLASIRELLNNMNTPC